MTQWDSKKNKANIAAHGISFSEFADFDWSHAELLETQVVDFEERELWAGPIGNHLCIAIVTDGDDDLRLISLRRATPAETKRWRNA